MPTRELVREPRNLVVCCDGTGNVLGNQHDTHVVRLARLCVKDARQLVFYDPGVGTASGLPSVDAIDSIQSKLTMVLGLAFGRGIYENISQAYEFLVQNYRAGDRIFMFGFSRGAFTVRCVSGLVTEYGIVRPSSLPLLPLMIRNYFAPHEERRPADCKAQQNRRCFTQDVREHFTDEEGRDAEIHFIGVWDTVSSVGGVRSMGFSTQPFLKGKPYRHVRHAVSEGEYRAKYAPRLYVGETRDTCSGHGEEREPSFKQVWFPGVHSDVGGSYAQAGLADGALLWMLEELDAVEGSKLRLVPDARSRPDWPQPDAESIAHDQALVSPLWALTGLQRRRQPLAADEHESLRVRRGRKELDIEPRLTFPRLAFFWWSYLASALSYVLLVLNTRSVAPAPLSPLQLAELGMTAVALPESERSQHADHLSAAYGSNALFSVAFGALACTVVVYAIRSLRDYKPRSERTHALFRCWTMYGLWAAIGGGVLESLLGCIYFSQAEWSLWGVPIFGVQSVFAAVFSLVCWVRWLGVLSLLGFWGFALARGVSGKAPRSEELMDLPAE
jgi:uncharacterized protein (DUF2235 family)